MVRKNGALRRTGVIVFSVLLVTSLVLSAIGYTLPRRSFPQTSGELTLLGLNLPVDIYRDALGIPHIYAQNTHDLFFAQGYVHAQDRFYQMDFWRHIGSGRLSEMFGSDMYETDFFLRTLGWARVAEQELGTLDPESFAILQAYADGVNSYLQDHRGSQLSLEYAVLSLVSRSYQPEPWTPLHTMTWAKVMAWDLSSQAYPEISRSLLSKVLTPEQLDEYYPAYPADHPTIVTAGQSYLPGQETFSTAYDPSLVESALEALHGKITGLNRLTGPAGAGIGSNNWVISGELTSTGLPFLANDPHLSKQMPSIWYEIGLHCREASQSCPYEVTGFSFAGAPGVIIGHNANIAWGFTNVGPDVEDLYIERINPANPDQYEVNGEWVEMTIVREMIEVAGEEAVQVDVRYTRHGPLVTEIFDMGEGYRDRSGQELPEQYAISLRWTALDPNPIFPAIWGFNRAQNWDEFRMAASYFAVPAQNLVYADTAGNIGYQMPGQIPIRKSGDGAMPVPGWTDDYEWTGFIPFDQLPSVFNPPEGYIVTANNRVAPESYPYLLGTYWDYGYRAQRIVDMIESAPGPIDAAYIAKMQGDNMSLIAAPLIGVLKGVDLNDDSLNEARSLLLGWDAQEHMDSAPAALFQVFWKNLLAETFQDDLPEDFWPGGGDVSFEFLRSLIQKPDSTWWDNRTTTAVETMPDIFRIAFAAAVTEIQDLQGRNMDKWNWGDLHTLVFDNQSLGQSGIGPVEAMFNRGPYRTSGGESIVNATGGNLNNGYTVQWLPSMRMIVDLSNFSASQTIHTTGQSGHAYHEHYTDMIDLWRTIQYHTMLWEREDVEAAAEGHLVLKP